MSIGFATTSTALRPLRVEILIGSTTKRDVEPAGCGLSSPICLTARSATVAGTFWRSIRKMLCPAAGASRSISRTVSAISSKNGAVEATTNALPMGST